MSKDALTKLSPNSQGYQSACNSFAFGKGWGNPYSEGSSEFYQWNAGWLDAFEDYRELEG